MAVIYMAPMEGLTGYVYRGLYRDLYGDVEKYFTPFIGAAEKKIIRTRDRKEVEPENNRGMVVVPQLLANRPKEFLSICLLLKELGYGEVNLNTGCPANTVVGRHRGAGILKYPEELLNLLEGIFEGIGADPALSGLKVSVKTRLGMYSADEFPGLLKIFNRYPLSELIIHARTRQDYYEGEPDLDAFIRALDETDLPLCYNGDIQKKEDYDRVIRLCEGKDVAVMIGRGIIADPGLVRQIRGGEAVDRQELQRYVKELYRRYRETMDSRIAVMRMKEVWCYLGRQFPEKAGEWKDLKKAGSPAEYESAVMRIFLG
ncbi:MAG: tRNA-dihydrouridine synthase family protein [Lachnospiraceae bacterium]|nr:tRNA-dihydrouridine synthase family protein [Lachnospiraceae bacterium]